jgi:hypothetical protein
MPGAPRCRADATPPAHPAGPRAFLLLALAAALALAFAPLLTPPAVVPADAPATAFSAERALAHLRVVAAEPHPLGSPEHDAAVAYLVEQLSGLGLEPHVQVSSAAAPAYDYAAASVPAARVQNVVARLPGKDSTGAVLLIGNYDSMPTTPGAGDPPPSAAVVLETLRALRAGPPLRNDVVVVFVDVEPNGTIGDQAFVAEHPWAKDVRLALAFASSGVGGAVALESTTPAGRAFVADLLGAAPHPLAYSSLTGLMQLIGGGGGPMLWIARAHDTPGLEFVGLDGPQTYHTMLNSVERLDPRLLQHHGSYALALARHFGDRPLDGRPGSSGAPELVYFTVAPTIVASYPAAWALPLALLAALALAGAAGLALRRGRLTPRGLALGLVAFPLGVLAAVAVASAAWWALKRFDPDHRVFRVGVAYNADVHHVGLVLLALSALAGAYALLGRWARWPDLAAAALVWLAVVAVLAGAAAPGLSYLFTWPLLAAALFLGWTVLAPAAAERPWPRAAALAVASAVTAVLMAPFVHVLFGLLIRMDSFLPVPVGSGTSVLVALALGFLLPTLTFLGGPRRWLVPGAAAATGLAVIVTGAATSAFDVDHPRPTNIAYVLDADAGDAAWVTTDEDPDPWTRRFFAAGAEPTGFLWTPNANPDWAKPAWRAPAPTVALAAPEVAVLEHRSAGGLRTLRLRATSPRGAPNLYLDVRTPGAVAAAWLDGKELDLSHWPADRRARFRLAYHAVPPEGIEIALTYAGDGPVEVRVEDRSNGLPAVPGVTDAPRPPDTMPAAYEMADPTIVARSLRIGG